MAAPYGVTIMQKGTVVVGGGTGFIGRALSRILTKDGFNVVAVSRKPGPERITWDEIEKKGLPEKCVAVVNLAGQNVLDPLQRWTPEFKEKVFTSRVHTTRLLTKAIQQTNQPPKVYSCVSGVGYYKPSTTAEYNEGSPGGDHDFFSILCKDWEEASILPPELGVRRVIIRSGVVLGRDGGMIAQLVWPFFFFMGGPVSPGSQYLPWIHINDIAGLFKHSIQTDMTGIFNGVAPEVITSRQFSDSLGEAMHRPSFIPLPKFAVNFIFGPERAVILTEGQKVVPKRTLETDYKFEHPTLRSATQECGHILKQKIDLKPLELK